MKEYEIFYGPHGFAKDLEGLATPLRKADIFLPECIAWSPVHLIAYNAVSKGLLRPQVAMHGFAAGTSHMVLSRDSALGFFNMLYRSHKPVAFIDLPAGHPLAARLIGHGNRGFVLGKEFSETLQNAEDHLRQIATMDIERENYQIAHLEPTVDGILKLNASLARRNPLKILLFEGAAHIRIGKILEASGKTVTQTFAYEPIIYPFQNEVTQRFIRGENVDEELMARAVMEMVVLLPTVFKIANNTRVVFEYTRKALSRFSVEEIERAFQEARTTGSYNTLTSLMREKAIPHPNSERDIINFLQS